MAAQKKTKRRPAKVGTRRMQAALYYARKASKLKRENDPPNTGPIQPL